MRSLRLELGLRYATMTEQGVTKAQRSTTFTVYGGSRCTGATAQLLRRRNPLGPPELLALEDGAGESLEALLLGYTESQGSPSQRAAIAGRVAGSAHEHDAGCDSVVAVVDERLEEFRRVVERPITAEDPDRPPRSGGGARSCDPAWPTFAKGSRWPSGADCSSYPRRPEGTWRRRLRKTDR